MNGTLNSIGFEKWLKEKARVLFNLVAEIIANRDSKDNELLFCIKMASLLQFTNYHQTKIQLRKSKEKISPK